MTEILLNVEVLGDSVESIMKEVYDKAHTYIDSDTFSPSIKRINLLESSKFAVSGTDCKQLLSADVEIEYLYDI